MWEMPRGVAKFCSLLWTVAGVILLAAVGLLTFDTLWESTSPPAWYLLLYLLENLITPVVLGRRFTLNPVVIFVPLMRAPGKG